MSKHIKATKAELIEIIEALLDTFQGWNDGCGCCSHMSGKDDDDFKKAAEMINYYE